MELRNQKTNFEAASAYAEKLLAKAKIEEEKAIIEDIVLALKQNGGMEASQTPQAIGMWSPNRIVTKEANMGRLLKLEKEGRAKYVRQEKKWYAC